MSKTETPRLNQAYIGVRKEILTSIPESANNILDIGCSNGALGNALKSRNSNLKVTGVEYDTVMADIATAKLDSVIQGDLNKTRLSDLGLKKGFDCIVMADILEHLLDPWQVLQDAVLLLKPDGVIVTSIPNIRHITTLLNLSLLGRWPYKDRGIHDKTHLRFFTRHSIIKMFTQAGLKVVNEKRNMRILENGTKINRLSVLFNLPLIRGLFTYQYVHVTRISG